MSRARKPAKRGRKRLGGDEPTVTRTLNAPASWWSALDKAAERRSIDSSKLIRELAECRTAKAAS